MKWRSALLTILLLGAGLAPVLADEPQILVAYYSETGNTEALAESVVEGARTVDGVSVMLTPVEEATPDDALAADAVILGSPVYNANVAPPVMEFVNQWPLEDAPMKDKIGAAFATGGGISAGEELVQLQLLQAMLVFGMIIVGGPEWTQAFGASAITGEPPFDDPPDDETIHADFAEKGEALGERVARLAKDYIEN